MTASAIGVWTMKVGDTDPPFECVLTDNGLPLSGGIAGATEVRLRVKKRGATTYLIDQPMTVVSAPDSQVSYQWTDPDTATAGQYDLTIRVTWIGGKKRTFPSEGAFVLKIEV